MEVTEESLEGFFSVVMPLLDERQQRLVAGAAARMLGPVLLSVSPGAK